jgi:pimeloyl-ACP methyl ester carboxylesterase
MVCHAGDEGFVPVEGGKLFYKSAGKGPAVIMIHGGFLDHRMWDTQVPALEEHYRVIRYDVRAHGQSPSETIEFADRDDLAALMDYLEIPKATIVGLSMGGLIAVDFTLTYPERVASLVLVGPGISGFQPDSPEIQRYISELTQSFEQDDFAGALDIFARYWYDGPHREPADTDPVTRNKIMEMLSGSQKRWEIFRLQKSLDPPAIGRLASIQAPTLVVLGTIDMPDIVDVVDRIEDQVPDVTRADIPGVAHMVNMEAPERFNEVLLQFLEDQLRDSP